MDTHEISIGRTPDGWSGFRGEVGEHKSGITERNIRKEVEEGCRDSIRRVKTMHPYPNIRIRAAGALLRENRILFQRNKKGDAWVLLGGGVETGETSMEAVEREFREELGLKVRALRPLCVIENFNAYEYEGLHEINICHMVTADGDVPVSDLPFKGKDPSADLTFRWIPLDELDHCKIFPRVLKDMLRNPPGRVKHFVNDDKEPAG